VKNNNNDDDDDDDNYNYNKSSLWRKLPSHCMVFREVLSNF